MEINPFYMSLSDRDLYLLQIERQIEAKRSLLLKKQKKMKNISKNNEFLNDIKNDYAKYYQYIIEQKQQQVSALDMLHSYINDLSVSGNLSKHNIDDAKHEQNKILEEMRSIKQNLDELVITTKNITNSLVK